MKTTRTITARPPVITTVVDAIAGMGGARIDAGDWICQCELYVFEYKKDPLTREGLFNYGQNVVMSKNAKVVAH